MMYKSNGVQNDHPQPNEQTCGKPPRHKDRNDDTKSMHIYVLAWKTHA